MPMRLTPFKHRRRKDQFLRDLPGRRGQAANLEDMPHGGIRTNLLFTMSWNRPGPAAPDVAKLYLADGEPAVFTSLKDGGARRDRTDDLMLAKHALSQLSYGPEGEIRSHRGMVGPGRLELPTSRLSGVRSNHLSYGPNPVAHMPERRSTIESLELVREERETKTAKSRQWD